MTRAVLTSVLLIFAAAASTIVQAQAVAPSQDSRLRFDVTPYFWASGLKGTVGVRDRTADVKVTFRELLDHLEGAAMLSVEARKGLLGFGVDGLWVKVSDDRATPREFFSGARLQAKLLMAEFGPRYRALQSKRAALDFLLGGRVWKLSNTLTLEQGILPEIAVDLDKSWIDYIGGARVFVNLTDRWLVQVRADAGGLGSDFTWQALGGVGYTFSQLFSLRAGYRYLDVDYRDSDGFIFDVALRGLILGGSFSFGAGTRAAASDGH